MIRNFVAGIVWGGIVGALGLGVVSQLSPIPVAPAAGQAPPPADVVPLATTTAVPAPAAEPATQAETAPQLAPPPAAQNAAPASAATGGPVAAATNDVPATPPSVAPGLLPQTGGDAVASDAAAVAVAPELTESPAPPAPVLVPEAPAVPDAPAAGANPPAVAALPDAAPGTAAQPAALPASNAADAIPSAAELPPAAPPEVQETLLNPAPALPKKASPALIEVDPTPDAPAADVATAPPPASLPTVNSTGLGSTLAPNTELPGTVAGVAEDRLPQIGDAPPVVAEPAPVADVRPIVAFARSFTNTSGKPAFAIVLRDTGGQDFDREKLAALPFPVSFVIDPAAPDAAAHAAVYRAAGQEVVMLATGIPQGATAADLEQTFQANAALLPEAVAVMDIGAAGFQDDRPLASLVVPVIGAQGRGVLTFDKGLNAADQVARREQVPAAIIFRDLDAEGEDVQKIRRYLDRAAFKAAQEGSVVVVGSTRPETIAALMEWTVEGRASSVALAPLTAVMRVQ